jgi:hypothetical protein
MRDAGMQNAEIQNAGMHCFGEPAMTRRIAKGEKLSFSKVPEALEDDDEVVGELVVAGVHNVETFRSFGRNVLVLEGIDRSEDTFTDLG